jgi:uncharacterized protein
MTKAEYTRLEGIMRTHMEDSAHDGQHVYRVLGTALQIAASYPEADLDVLIAACLLHDIGRAAQYRDRSVSHAEAGADMARAHLLEEGWDEARADQAAEAIRSHRFRGHNRPGSLEAKILYDADKLDVTGAMGVARSLMYQGIVGEPLYSVDGDGAPLDGHEDAPSFLNEYVIKLSRLYDGFYTPEGACLARPRAAAARDFYESLLREARGGGPLRERLDGVLK